ncbi:MAG: type II toxin-antitoxin system RelE/ParE family toxin [Bacteroidales bacterium]|nr:type II toxin-antitoxin system RelE/ParE family toxin [Bacteroidales bacterium]MBQ5540434.1 type II toxin-antitoxin system RelE/ParE family toxin [Bacteroidales bacterium]
MEEQQTGFEVVYMEDASEFLKNLPEQPRKKIYYNISKVAGGIKDSELFKKLDGADDFWEFRTLYNGLQYRLLAFWDKKSKRLVVATHGFVKKTWKVSAKEIAKAEALRKEYYESEQ